MIKNWIIYIYGYSVEESVLHWTYPRLSVSYFIFFSATFYVFLLTH